VLIRLVPTLALSFVILFVPGAAAAQSAAPAWDVAVSGGLFAAHTPRVSTSGYQDRWLHAVQGGAVVGRHLSPHLKVEVEATATTSGTELRERLVTVPGVPYPYPIPTNVTMSTCSLGSALTWQFGRNEWVHPFVQAGLAADFDRETALTWDYVFSSDPRTGVTPTRAVARVEGPVTTTAIRGVLGGGAKVYMTQKAFVRPEARWHAGRDRHHLAFRLGVGIDF
jgi:hypothetical protein